MDRAHPPEVVEKPVEIEVFDQRNLNEVVDRLPQFLRRFESRGRLGQALERLTHVRQNQRPEEILLPLEMLVERAFADAGLGRDVGHAGAVVTAASEHGAGRGKDLAATLQLGGTFRHGQTPEPTGRF